MLRQSNHIGFIMALALAALYAACSVRPTAAPVTPTTPAGSAPELTSLPIKSPPATTTLPFRPSPTPAAALEPTKATTSLETWSEESPDGKWLATTQRLSVQEPCSLHTSLIVAENRGPQVWTAWKDDQPCALGTTVPKPLHWSLDGNSLYFTNVPSPDGCPEFVNGSDLQRLNLRTGQVSQLMPGLGLALALSPDETQLAYIAYAGRGLQIRDLATGRERGLILPDGPAGSLVWAPDASALALTLDVTGCSQANSVMRVDTRSLAITTLVESDPRKFVTTEWTTANTLVVVDKDKQVWQLNVETGKLSPA